ncbi:uncharacterized protein PODANS_1_17100 [Podospora anserina S mat+]|uniref:Phosphoribosylaminoimidazole-succinocarboxamide synthase n=1 Tax=Podospora anserina (strain S / ATCC MYA-4624 / DSM 980 / FGSC 10383) TaxID=515849 RepID=B2ATV7_PODAN|nr:uncharacterized protein PODANS_1_17100 [Podospora anserina S mat+]CAP67830.1 unnamed protein product [Podospora anserina S mat+]
MSIPVVTNIELSSLAKLASGKVRDLYNVDDKTLLFVTTDRISAYDVIMANGVPLKGAVLTNISAHWFKYKKSGTVHGLAVPAGLQQCSPFPEPIYTPSTKAELGQHDENITPEQAAKIVGEKYAARIEALALKVYKAGAAYAAERGIIIADTKFEFGLDEETDEIVLIDEVLTPDSSRFWPADEYEVGRDQDSFDKQFLRNWLTKEGLKGKDGVEMPADIAQSTSERYLDAFKRLTGKTLQEALQG